jgi:hypothetical protein
VLLPHGEDFKPGADFFADALVRRELEVAAFEDASAGIDRSTRRSRLARAHDGKPSRNWRKQPGCQPWRRRLGAGGIQTATPSRQGAAAGRRLA